jgi:hypothetical protein
MSIKHYEHPSMKAVKYIMSNILLLTGEQTMKITSLLLLVYVVLQTMGLALFE